MGDKSKYNLVFWYNWKIYILIASFLFLLFLFIRLFIFFPSYIFNVTAKSDVFTLKIPDNFYSQKWLIKNAIICSKKPLKLNGQKQEVVPQNICRNKKLHAYKFSFPESILELVGGTEVQLELLEDNSLALAINNKAKNDIKLSFTNNNPDIVLSSKINIRWPPNTVKELTFPFTGNTTIGRDVSWFRRGILHTGSIRLYTSDFLSASKSVLIDQTPLVLGDQVSLHGKSTANKNSFPKGFVRYSLKQDKQALDIVAFGEAKVIRVERYGDNGYEFKPGFWARVSKDTLLIAFGTILLALISLLSNLMDIFRKN